MTFLFGAPLVYAHLLLSCCNFPSEYPGFAFQPAEIVEECGIQLSKDMTRFTELLSPVPRKINAADMSAPVSFTPIALTVNEAMSDEGSHKPRGIFAINVVFPVDISVDYHTKFTAYSF